jgi:hypothetical protein
MKKIISLCLPLPIAAVLVWMIACAPLPVPVPVVHAQYSQTITQTLLQGAAPSVTPIIINNIGQGVHSIIAISHNAPTHSCGGLFAGGLFGASGAGLPQTLPLPQTVTYSAVTTGNNVVRTYQYTGVFPVITFQWTVYDAVNCIYDVYYTGSVGNTSGPGVLPSLAFENATTLQKYTGTYNTSGDNSFSTGALTSTGQFFSVYGFQICNNTAAQTVTMLSYTGAGAGYVYDEFPNMAAGQCVGYPPGQVPLWSSYWGYIQGNILAANIQVLNFHLSTSSLISYAIWYKFE